MRKRLRDLTVALGVPRAGADEPGTDVQTDLTSGSTGATQELTDRIPIVHRLAIIYVILPVVVWLIGWFEWWFGISAALLLTLALWPVLKPEREDLNWQTLVGSLRQSARPTTIALLLIAFAWVMMTAAGGVFDVNNFDWNTVRSLFLDLGRGDWPTEPPPDLRAYLDTPFTLRHYLGYFMVPGLLGNWLGAVALNWAVPLWTWCGAALAVSMFTRGFRGWRLFAAAAVFIFFGGMDIVRTVLFEGWDWIDFQLDILGWPGIELGRYHIEWVGNRWDVIIQYQSHTAALLWSPKHFLPAAIYTLLLVQLRRHPQFLAVSGVLFAAAPFWSVFVAIGILPLIAALAYQNGVRPFLRWQNILLALPLALLVAVFLSSGTTAIGRNWIWELHQDGFITALKLLLTVYVFDFLVIAVLLLYLQNSLRRDPYFIACLATLFLMPLYSYGDNNDWVMRGVMPALIVLTYCCARVVLYPSKSTARTNAVRFRVAFGILLAVLGIGAITPLFDLARANNNHDFGVERHERLGPEFSVMRSLEVAHPRYHVTNEFPDWFFRLLRIDANDATSARGELIAQSKYYLYLEVRRLIYIREPCPEDEEGSQFFLHVSPVDPSALPEGRTHENLDFFLTRPNAFKIGQTCFAVRVIPGTYAIGHFKTGQYSAERTGHSWIVHYYSEPYRRHLLASAGEPIIRSRYQVYLLEDESRAGLRRLVYYNPDCSQADLDSRFFLHVRPVDAAELPEGSKGTGYAALDFEFVEFGWSDGETCFAVRELPAYEIQEIRTGQTSSEGQLHWEGAYTIP